MNLSFESVAELLIYEPKTLKPEVESIQEWHAWVTEALDEDRQWLNALVEMDKDIPWEQKELALGRLDLMCDRWDKTYFKIKLNASQNFQDIMADMSVKSKAWKDERHERCMKYIARQFDANHQPPLQVKDLKHVERLIYQWVDFFSEGKQREHFNTNIKTSFAHFWLRPII